MTRSVFEACFSDFRIVKGRKVGQLIFELPLEAVDAALETLGGVPRPDREAWVGIARIQHDSAPEAEPKKLSKLSLSQQSALTCQKPSFQQYLNERFHKSCLTADEAAGIVRDYCRVESRASLDSDQRAATFWQVLNNDYEAWLAVYA